MRRPHVGQLEAFFGFNGYPRDLDVTTASFPTERQADAAAKALALAPPGVVLDLGCGYGRMLEPLSRHTGRVVIGIDVVDACCTIAAKRGPVVWADNRALPFASASVAGTVSFFTSVGYDDTRLENLFAEIVRVLQPGGVVLLDTVARRSAGTKAFSELLPDGRVSAVQEERKSDGTCTVTSSLQCGTECRTFRLSYRTFDREQVVHAARQSGLQSVYWADSEAFSVSRMPRITLAFILPIIR